MQRRAMPVLILPDRTEAGDGDRAALDLLDCRASECPLQESAATR